MKDWILASELKPGEDEWPIFAYFGKAADGCKGPCVMLNNWNDTFTHWQSIPYETIMAVWKTVKLPNPPKARTERRRERPELQG